MALSPEESQQALGRLTANARGPLIATLVKARNDIQRRIAVAAANSQFSRRKDVREALYDSIQSRYGRLNSELSRWADGLASKSLTEAAEEAIDDLRAQGLSQRDTLTKDGLVRFSSKHFDDMSKRVNPFTVHNRAAVNAHLGGMAAKDIRQLRVAVSDVFQEAAGLGISAPERQAILQDRVTREGKNLSSWQFIDKSGKRWKKGNYFNMLNRTIAAEVHRESYDEAVLESGEDLVVVIGGNSDHDQVCKNKPVGYVGQILSISGADKRFPSMAKAREDGLFHPNCCVEGTVVTARDIKAAHRFEYSGKVIEVELAGGDKFTVTPNHQLLGPAGFVAANTLNIGDNLLRCSDSEGAGDGVPDVKDGQARIEDIFVAISESSGVTARKMPMAPEYFHGDGIGGNTDVDIILSDRHLWNCAADSEGIKHLDESQLAIATQATIAGFASSPLAEVFMAAGHASNRIVRGSSDALGELGTTPLVSDAHLLGLSPGGNATCDKKSPDDARAYPFDISEFIESRASEIELDEVVSVNVRDFSGHVYDLHTFSTLYAIGSTLSSNCVHSTKALVVGFGPSDALIAEQAGEANPKIRKPKPRAKTQVKTVSA